MKYRKISFLSVRLIFDEIKRRLSSYAYKIMIQIKSIQRKGFHAVAERSVIVLLLLFLILFVSGSCMAGYAIKTAVGHLTIIWNARPIEEVIADESTPDQVRQRLLHVLDVREYAEKHLALKPGKSYTQYSDIGRKAAAWNVTASEPLALKPRTWFFPIVGRIPYIGFYSREEAEEFAQELEKQGYDVMVSEVPAYSTLGWFADPVLSSQTAYPEWYLTRLVIHESVHATVWIPGDVNFNESLATFAEKQGTLQYYLERKGMDDPFVKKYLKYTEERKRLNEYISSQAERLNEIYRSSLTDKEKLTEKEKFINNFKTSLREMASEFEIIKPEMTAGEKINNAFFLSYIRYDSGEDILSRIFEESGRNWKEFYGKIRTMRPEDRVLNRFDIK